MVSRAFFLLCVLLAIFSVAIALDTCATDGVGPCVGGFCPSDEEVCINGETCCLVSEVNVPAGGASPDLLKVLKRA